MATVPFKNPWGAANSGVDQQRSDLFYVTLEFPRLLLTGGTNTWDQECGFAVERFPFPDRARQMIPVKWMNQTNHQIGADEASGPIDMGVRYAFNRRAAELLERWHWITSNPATGGVATTSAIKTNGMFVWYIPNMAKIANVDDLSTNDVLIPGSAYRLEGCLVRNYKPSDANMTTGNEGVVLTFSLQIDRYYPVRVSDLDPSKFASAANRGLFAGGVGATTVPLTA
jgi:hypothetical protein